MALISVYKVVSSVPASLDSNALYLVRTGTGFDFYVSDSTGSVAYQINSSAAGLSNLVEDTTPQLGGDLDLNGNDITGTGNISITGEIEADIHIGSLRGEIQFKAKAGEALTKGDPVYISNYDTVGNTPIVAIADANDSAKMPCFGLANESVSLNASVNVVTFGTLSGLDTSGFGLGDTLYISNTGTLTNSKPAGESSLIQNIGKVQRVDNSAGSIKVGGAGRTNDVPNLNQGNVFIGNASNQAETRGLTLDDIAETATNKHFTSGDESKLSGVETGATADQTDAEIKTAYENNANTNAFTDAEKSKLSGVETGATADQTAAEILTAIKTVDGAGSGLDADTLDGVQGSAFAQSNTDATFSGVTISTSSTPSSRTATGTQGQLAYDEYFSYVCTATDRWRRSSLFEPQYIPTTILSNLILWHEMADAWEVGLVSGAVDSVKDLSGNDFSATQSTATNRPSFSSKVAEFDGINHYLDLPSNAVTDLQSTSQTTTFIVCESVDTSLGTIFGIADTTKGSKEHIIRQRGNGSVELSTRGSASGLTSLQTSIPTTNERMLIIYRANGTDTLLSARGGGVTNNNSYSASSVSWDSCVGANKCKYGINEDSGGVQWQYDGKIYEGMVFKTGLSDTMMETVADYFKNKYDIDW